MLLAIMLAVPRTILSNTCSHLCVQEKVVRLYGKSNHITHCTVILVSISRVIRVANANTPHLADAPVPEALDRII